MIVLEIVLVALAVGVVWGLLRRSRRRRRPLAVAPPRAPMPSVLVSDQVARPSLEEPTSSTLASRLSASRGVFDRVRSLGSATNLLPEQLDTVEEVLLRSDVGVDTTNRVLSTLRSEGAPQGLLHAVRAAVLASLSTASRELSTSTDDGRVAVWLFVGVNGVGKTTTIGKIAHARVASGEKIVLAAGDTFRAAASEQLALWGERSGTDVVRAHEGADPSSVVHDAVGRASARGYDLVLADTAGRNHTSSNLLDELAKIRRVADREPGQVTETLLVIDATTGQNAITQTQQFLAAAQVTGIVLTKLDGTARGGIVVAIEESFGVPVKLIGTGEGASDLIAFDPIAFVDALLEV